MKQMLRYSLLHIFGILIILGLVESKYLIITSPATNSVWYSRLLTADEQSKGDKMTASQLTVGTTTEDPMGIAVDNVRGLLYVADPTRQVIIAMRISEDFSGSIYTQSPKDIVTGVDSRWVAVNSVGSIFFTDTANGQIWSMSAADVERKLGEPDSTVSDSQVETSTPATTIPQKVSLYNGSSSTLVQAPEGIAVNGYSVFWANGETGDQGVVVKGYELPQEEDRNDELSALATNTASARGVCLSNARVFYTDITQKLYSMRIGGGPLVTVSEALNEPRGCAYDGDGTIFIADKADGKVYSFAGGGPTMGRRLLSPALAISDAYGLAVFMPEASGTERLSYAFVTLCLSLMGAASLSDL